MTHWTSREAAIVAQPRRRDVVIHKHDDEVVVSLPVEGSTFHLNGTAAFVWEQCDGRRTTRDIATALSDDYDVAFDDALNDVEELVVWLAESCLLGSVPAR
ncbi:MAG: PqqD family protein [Phycisphaerales bacterium]